MPAALDLVLNAACLEPVGATVSAVAMEQNSTGPIARCFVAVGDAGYHLFATSAGAVLMDSTGMQKLARVSAREIAEHERQAKADA